ncbi:MAG: hypothetical protein LBI29_01720 [Rickettsiales bacterium]|jgi:hypothetical protein|nr:hypothetical protein [Rickettsiales bacterium]
MKKKIWNFPKTVLILCLVCGQSSIVLAGRGGKRHRKNRGSGGGINIVNNINVFTVTSESNNGQTQPGQTYGNDANNLVSPPMNTGRGRQFLDIPPLENLLPSVSFLATSSLEEKSILQYAIFGCVAVQCCKYTTDNRQINNNSGLKSSFRRSW